MAQSMASTSVTNGSSWRSWRPGYWIASSSTSAGRRASQPRKVPALPPAGGSAIRRRRGCALPLRCNHRARARSVAGGNGGASAAWQRRTTSRASGSPCNSPRLCLPVSRRNSAIACTPNSECPPALAKPLVGRQRPAEHPGQHLEHPPQLHAVLGLDRRGRLRRVLEQRQQRLAVGVGQCLGALGGKRPAAYWKPTSRRSPATSKSTASGTSTSTTTWSRPPDSRRRRGVVLVEIDEVEQAVQAQLAVAPANRQRMAPMLQARALVVECATGAVEQIDGSRQPARQGIQEQAEQAVRSRLLGAPVADEAADHFVGIAEAAQRPAMRRQQQRTQGQAAAFGQARKRGRLSAGTSTRTAAMRRGPSSARPGNGR